MSGRTFSGVVLTCDACKHVVLHHEGRGTEAELKAAVDAKATAAGWAIREDAQVCPSCSKRVAN